MGCITGKEISNDEQPDDGLTISGAATNHARSLPWQRIALHYEG